MATGLPYCPAKSVILPPGHMMRRLSARGGGFTLSNKALQASLASACFFCTLYKYVIIYSHCILLEPFV